MNTFAPSIRPKISDVQEIVAKAYGLSVADLKSVSKTSEKIAPRWAAMWLVRKLCHASLPKIGREFGGRDHTTVCYALRRFEQMIAADPLLAASLDRMAALANAKALETVPTDLQRWIALGGVRVAA